MRRRNLIGLVLIIILTMSLSCSYTKQNSNLSVKNKYYDSLFIKLDSIQPDFVLFPNDSDFLELTSTSKNRQKSDLTHVKIYYDKNKNVSRIIVSEYVTVIDWRSELSFDGSKIFTESYHSNPKSVQIDFSDTFKKYRINYKNYYKD
jgi:hypothetical protein